MLQNLFAGIRRGDPVWLMTLYRGNQSDSKIGERCCKLRWCWSKNYLIDATKKQENENYYTQIPLTFTGGITIWIAFIQIHWEFYTWNAIETNKRIVSCTKAANNKYSVSAWRKPEHHKMIRQQHQDTFRKTWNEQQPKKKKKSAFGIVNKLKRGNKQAA